MLSETNVEGLGERDELGGPIEEIRRQTTEGTPWDRNQPTAHAGSSEEHRGTESDEQGSTHLRRHAVVSDFVGNGVEQAQTNRQDYQRGQQEHCLVALPAFPVSSAFRITHDDPADLKDFHGLSR